MSLGDFKTSNSSVFSSLEPDYINDALVLKQRTLLELAMDMMLSKMCLLLQSEGKIPPSLHIKLTVRALETRRINSTIFLIERYPIKEFIVPFSDTVKHCTVLLQQTLPNHLLSHLTNARDNAFIVAFCFLRSIIQKNTVMRVMDFNQFPHKFDLLPEVFLFAVEKIPDNEQYEVKGNFIFLKDDHFTGFCQVKEKLHPKLKFTLTGMHIGHTPMKIQFVADVFKLLDAQELRHFYVEYCINRISELFVQLQRFQNLTSLFLSNIVSTKQGDYEDLADLLYRLPLLTRLSLRGSKLGNRLGMLLLKNCKREEFPEPKRRRINNQRNQPNCCVLHRGKLQSLDVSRGDLVEKDLDCLKRYPLCDNLKYLNLADNSFQTPILAQFLESYVSNLIVLSVENCMSDSTNLTPFFNTLGKFIALEYVVIGKWNVERHHMFNLNEALFKIPSLKEVRMFCPRTEKQEDFEALLNLKKGVKFVWQE